MVGLLKKDSSLLVAERTREAIGIFLQDYPTDKDAKVFAGVYAKISA